MVKGFTKDGKFHPINNNTKGVRKSRDQSTKTQGVRKARNRFHPKGYKPPTFGKKKPEGTWEITKTDYGSSKNVEIFNDEVTIYDDNGQEVVKWISDEWKEDPSIIPAIKNAIKLAKQGRIDEIKERIGFIERGTVDRKARDEQVITIDGHSTNIPASPDSTEDEDRYVEETVRIGLIKRRQALALIKRSPKGIDQMEIREILGSEALPEIRVLTDIDKTVVEKDGIFKVVKK